MTMSRQDVYGSSTVNRRRRNRAEVQALDDAIVSAIEQDAPVTLRGVFYRAMSAGAIPKTELGYRAVGRRLIELRRRGRVSYGDITDGTRWITKPKTFGGWEEAIEDAARSYRRALWRSSPYSLQLFTEKDAISGVIVPVTERWDVPLGVLRGYSSAQLCERQRPRSTRRPRPVGCWSVGRLHVEGSSLCTGSRCRVQSIGSYQRTDRPMQIHVQRTGLVVPSRSMPFRRRRFERSSSRGCASSSISTS